MLQQKKHSEYDKNMATVASEIIAPIYDDDGEIDDILTVNINGEIIEDEEAAMESSD